MTGQGKPRLMYQIMSCKQNDNYYETINDREELIRDDREMSSYCDQTQMYLDDTVNSLRSELKNLEMLNEALDILIKDQENMRNLQQLKGDMQIGLDKINYYLFKHNAK